MGRREGSGWGPLGPRGARQELLEQALVEQLVGLLKPGVAARGGVGEPLGAREHIGEGALLLEGGRQQQGQGGEISVPNV